MFLKCIHLLPKWYAYTQKQRNDAWQEQETSVQSLGQEDPLEKEMATHCSIPA